MEDKEIIEELINIGEENFVSFSPDRIEEIKNELNKVRQQIRDFIDVKKEQH